MPAARTEMSARMTSHLLPRGGGDRRIEMTAYQDVRRGMIAQGAHIGRMDGIEMRGDGRAVLAVRTAAARTRKAVVGENHR